MALNDGYMENDPTLDDLAAAALLTQFRQNFADYRSRFSSGSRNASIVNGKYNLATLRVWDENGILQYDRTACSAYSSLTKSLKATVVGPVPKGKYGKIGIAPGCQMANHTEPKLFCDWIAEREASGNNYRPSVLELASELDFCSSCRRFTVDIITATAGLLDMNGAGCTLIYVETNNGIVGVKPINSE